MKANSLAQLISDSAKRYHHQVAVKIQNETITYQELLDRATTVAIALKEQGANKEAIGLVGQRHMSSYVGVLGILLSGCWYVPINPKFSKNKVTSIINDSKIRLLVGDINNFSKINQSLEDSTCNKIDKKIIPFEFSKVGNDGIDEKYIHSINSKIETHNINERDLAYVMYTSGSTGNPKGVQVTNANVLSYLDAICSLWKLPERFRMSQFHDLSFDPSVSDIFYTWCNGGVLCIVPEEDMLLPADFIINEKIDVWSSVPSIGSFMLNMGLLNNNNFPNLKIIRFAGEPFSKKIADAWKSAAPNSTIENHYGPTEATIDVASFYYTNNDITKVFTNDILPIGNPLPGMKIAVIDNCSNKVNVGKIGELVYTGPQITSGYLNDQEKTNLVFVRFDWDLSGDIWYKSGDLGFYNQDGNLECIGRKDNQIKLGGRRIEIEEIEATLSKFSLLQDVVVVAIKDENKITTGCVAFTMNEISQEEQKNIRQKSTQYLEKVFFPKKIVTVAQFPRLPSGKIDRKNLILKAQSL